MSIKYTIFFSQYLNYSELATTARYWLAWKYHINCNCETLSGVGLPIEAQTKFITLVEFQYRFLQRQNLTSRFRYFQFDIVDYISGYKKYEI
jgi:hypothetical protein